jgi:hypothetical protein
MGAGASGRERGLAVAAVEGSSGSPGSTTGTASAGHHQVETAPFRKNLQLNNQSRPVLFTNGLQVISYYREICGLNKLYQGLGVTLVRQALYCPIFALSLGFLGEQLNPF